MAHMVKPGVIDDMRRKYDDLAVVCYINSTAELKCQSDVCVTSSNAIKIVKGLPNKNIFFIPDKNLGRFVAEQIPEKNIILNDGCCPIHAEITKEQIEEEKRKHPDAKILTHPECGEDVIRISDYIGSTAEIIEYAKNDLAEEFVICTEKGVEYKLMKDNPQKKFFFVTPEPCCRDMKLNNLENILKVLENEDKVVEIAEEMRNEALKPLDRMLECAK